MKYKLVKCYPDSPKLGSITSKGGLDNRYTYYGCYSLPVNPEEYPEFWEKVVEKKWEVLSLRCIDTDATTDYEKVTKTYGVYKTKDRFVECYLNSELWEIYSIKRISDGEVFAIGDTSNYGKITGFRIQYGTLQVSLNGLYGWHGMSDKFELDNKVVVELTTTQYKKLLKLLEG